MFSLYGDQTTKQYYKSKKDAASAYIRLGCDEKWYEYGSLMAQFQDLWH